MTHGACLVLQHAFDAGEALEIIEREQCTAVYAMPNMALALHGHPDRAERDLSTLRTGLTMPATVPHMIEIGVKEMCACYGLTEGYGNSTVTDASLSDEIRSTTCGETLPNTEAVIADPETHAPLPRGAVGEVKIRGYVITEYFKNPERNAALFDADGYLLTGDLGTFTPEGYFQFKGRIREMVKTGGMNVSPAEVEKTIEDHAAVLQAVVVGIPDPVKQEVLAAAVVLVDGAAVSEDELRAYCRREMAAYKVPTVFAFMQHDEVPLTDTGKVSRLRLQDWFREHLKKGV
jgi:fatty-acyl-CoA synthase